ncbi:MAG: hypothetical protein JHC93_03455 [Parachlamydiales bacterium]|nr:hypothetical protein [Parachlamydiales bacterium]
MQRAITVRILICVACLGLFLFLYVEKQIEVTRYQLRIPFLAKEVHTIQEANIHLRYEIDQFENPLHLMELSRKPEFGHLHYPRLNEIVLIAPNCDKDLAKDMISKELSGSEP